MLKHPQRVGQRLLRVFARMLLGSERVRFYETIDWQQEIDRFRHKDLSYPAYYSQQNFHGIEGGYLNAVAAITYDPVAAIASPPNEAWIRQQVLTAIRHPPAYILDLGCGTGATTLMLKQSFPQARVLGLDLSPYMLVLADHKARHAELEIQWQQGLAEMTGFGAATFDLITIAFLLHETPLPVSQAILQEGFRLLQPGGQLIVLDGNQSRLRCVSWLADIFREPYSKAYAAQNVTDWMEQAGFKQVQTQPIGWISQITHGVKPRQFH